MKLDLALLNATLADKAIPVPAWDVIPEGFTLQMVEAREETQEKYVGWLRLKLLLLRDGKPTGWTEHMRINPEHPLQDGETVEGHLTSLIVSASRRSIARWLTTETMRPTFARVDRQRGILTVWKENTAGEPKEIVRARDLVRSNGPGSDTTSPEARTWEAVVAALTGLGVVVEENC